ncbi:MAG TPA: pseudouridine synthase [Thermoanaerobaculia bacterium]|nr:pseudouridine synthase [Thermoanaerobaculia bacterium]
MSEERLQKLLARAGIASRRKAEELIREGRVTVNGQVAAIGDKADLERDSVKLDERRIHALSSHRYLLLNKPRGVMSTVSDPGGRPTVIDLVPPPLRKALVPVGRLDFLTEGLLLLTDDGELAQRIAHPSHGCTKTYEVKVRGRPDEQQLDRLRAGIVLEGRRTAPCRITPRRLGRHRLGERGDQRPAPSRGRRSAPGTAGGRAGARAVGDSSWWVVELGEGRTRQIREMFQRVGHPVQKLRRVAIGPVSDPGLPLGTVRELTGREVEALRKARPGAADLNRAVGGAAGRAAGLPHEPGKGGQRAGRSAGAKGETGAGRAPGRTRGTSGGPRSAGRSPEGRGPKPGSRPRQTGAGARPGPRAGGTAGAGKGAAHALGSAGRGAGGAAGRGPAPPGSRPRKAGAGARLGPRAGGAGGRAKRGAREPGRGPGSTAGRGKGGARTGGRGGGGGRGDRGDRSSAGRRRG